MSNQATNVGDLGRILAVVLSAVAVLFSIVYINIYSGEANVSVSFNLFRVLGAALMIVFTFVLKPSNKGLYFVALAMPLVALLVSGATTVINGYTWSPSIWTFVFPLLTIALGVCLFIPEKGGLVAFIAALVLAVVAIIFCAAGIQPFGATGTAYKYSYSYQFISNVIYYAATWFSFAGSVLVADAKEGSARVCAAGASFVQVPGSAGACVTPKISSDELIQLKGLLDAGIITQEEYDVQKKKCLGL